MFKVFKYKNFRLFFLGLIISQIGVWIQNVAISWYIYELTNSAFIMGIATFLSTLPLLLFTPFAGVLIDRFDKKKLLLLIQILFAIQAAITTILAYTNNLHVYNIIILGFMLNMLCAIDGPLRQTLFNNLVENKEELTNAISINSSCFNLVKLIAPTIAGLVITNLNINACFLINFLCIIPNICFVSQLNFKKTKNTNLNKGFIKNFREGLIYLSINKRIKYLQLFIAVFCFFSMTYPMLMPIYTKDIFKAHADTLGYLLGAIGIGALVSSLLIATKKNTKGLKEIMLSSCFLMGICMVIFGTITDIKIAPFITFSMGLFLTGFITPQISLLQNNIKDNYRGRIMSYNTIAILGTTSISTFFAGVITQKLGILNTYIIFGIILIITSLFFNFKFKNIKL